MSPLVGKHGDGSRVGEFYDRTVGSSGTCVNNGRIIGIIWDDIQWNNYS